MSVRVLTAGFLVCDIIAAGLSKIAEPGELVWVEKGIDMYIGGHPANVSIDLVKIGYDPSRILVVGVVGYDVFGDFIEKTLKSYNLNVNLYRVKEAGTTKNIVLVVKGEDRRFHVDLGASWYMKPEMITRSIADWKPKLLYLACGIIGEADEKLPDILNEARRQGAVTFVDLAPPYGKDWDFIIGSLEYIDIFHCNLAELKHITREEKLRNAVKKMLGYGVKVLAITLGGEGAYIAKDDTLIYQPAFKIEAIDPTGAGDAFSAGMIFKLIELLGEEISGETIEKLNVDDLQEILLWGQAAGASACLAPGTTTSVSRENIEKLIVAQKNRIISEQRIEKI